MDSDYTRYIQIRIFENSELIEEMREGLTYRVDSIMDLANESSQWITRTDTITRIDARGNKSNRYNENRTGLGAEEVKGEEETNRHIGMQITAKRD